MNETSPASDGGSSSDCLVDLVYDQLRRLAQLRIAEERRDHTLQATALVHEVYIRLSEGRERPWSGRAEFFAAAAEAMRRVLIDHSRKHGAAKRGGGRERKPLNVVDLAENHDPDVVLALDEAIVRLEHEEPRVAAVVRLRFYAGLSVDETAEVTGQSRRTVLRDWEYARAWLRDALSEEI